jgi:hypothetical protein
MAKACAFMKPEYSVARIRKITSKPSYKSEKFEQ